MPYFSSIRLSYIVTLALVNFAICLPMVSMAKEQGTNPNGVPREFVKAMIERPPTIEEAKFLLALSGSSSESINAIQADLMQKAKYEDSKIKCSLENDKVMINGKFSGLQISSYSPLELNYKGRVWRSKASSSADQNYFALMSIFEQASKRSAANDLLFSTAHAQSRGEDEQFWRGVGFKIGGMAGIVAGGGACVVGSIGTGGVAVAGCSLIVTSTMAAGASVGAGLGYGAAFVHGIYKEHTTKNLIKEIANSQKSLFMCDPFQMTIGNFAKGTLTYLRDSGTITVNDADSDVSGYADKSSIAYIKDLASKCNNSEDAQKLTKVVKSAAIVAESENSRVESPQHVEGAKSVY